jgi:hypothetical protein
VPFTHPLAPHDRSRSPTVSRLPQQVIALSEVPRTDTGEFVRRRDVSERTAHAAKPTNAVPFPLISIGGTGTTPPRNQSSRCHPAAVRLSRPARSSDSSTSPRRSLLTARQSRGFARVSTVPRAKLYSTRSSRLCRKRRSHSMTGVDLTADQSTGSRAQDNGKDQSRPRAAADSSRPRKESLLQSSTRTLASQVAQDSPTVLFLLDSLWGTGTARSFGFSRGNRLRSFDHLGSSRSAKSPARGIRPSQNQGHFQMSWSTYTA